MMLAPYSESISIQNMLLTFFSKYGSHFLINHILNRMEIFTPNEFDVIIRSFTFRIDYDL